MTKQQEAYIATQAGKQYSPAIWNMAGERVPVMALTQRGRKLNYGRGWCREVVNPEGFPFDALDSTVTFLDLQEVA